MPTLKITPHYLNSYEAAHNLLSKKELFKQSQWELSAKKGDLDTYITLLANEDKIKDKQKFYKDFNYQYLDDRDQITALYTELFSDRTNVNKDAFKYVQNEFGDYVQDEKGELLKEFTNVSDYEFNKYLLNEKSKKGYEKYLRQQEQERKDSLSGFEKAFNTVLAIPGEFAVGVLDQVDNVFNSMAAIGEGVNSAIKTGDINKAWKSIVNTNAHDTWRLFEQLGVQDWIIDFERRYSDMRDVDGNYSNFGKYAGSIANTLGMLIPSILTSKFTGGVSKGLGANFSTSSTISKATSSLVFYQGMTAGNVKDIYREMAKTNVSIPSGAILANASIKSALQYGVEVGLGRLLGGSALDNVVFGRSVSTGTAKTLTSAGAKRLFHDFVTEGTEEVLQDTSDFLVDRAYSVLINENFGKLTNLTWQSLSDAFIIGGLASFSGSAMKILGTSRKELGKIKRDADGNIVKYNKDVKSITGKIIHNEGDVKFEKLNKLASWEYGLNMQSFMQNFAILQEQGKGLVIYDNNSKEALKYATAFTEMYAAYRLISSIYTEIGDERFKAANDLLTEITHMINDGKFDSATLKNASSEVLQVIDFLDNNHQQLALKKLKQANITKIVKTVERGGELTSEDLPADVKDTLKSILNDDKTVDKIVLTKDGNNIVSEDKVLFVPIEYMRVANKFTLYRTIAEQTLVENIVKREYKGLPVANITKLFRDISNKDTATSEEAIYNLIFNDSFLRIVLSTANKDVYKFVTSLIEMEETAVPNSLRTSAYKDKINTTIKNMKKSIIDYACNQLYAPEDLDFLSTEEKSYIEKTRWCKNLYNRVMVESKFKQLTADDWTVLNNRVNSLPVDKQEKEIISKNLHSEVSSVRMSAMNRIASVYKGIFTSKYDGDTYMPETSIPNRTFNSWLQSLNLTIETMYSMEVDETLKKVIVDTYGEFNKNTLSKFRADQFNDYVYNKGRYVIRINDKGKVGIFEASTNKQVGFSNYNVQQNLLLRPTVLDKRTVIERGNKKSFIVKELLNDSVDEITASYLSVDDVIVDPLLLNEQIQADILLKYKRLDIESTFLYLREHLLNKYETVTVILLADGTYAFGDVRPMLSSLKNNSLKITPVVKITQLIKSEYLYGRLANISIKTTNDISDVAQYDAITNTIYINKSIASKGGNLLTFAFLHEFQHAIQIENGMNIGINADWINNKYIAKTTRSNIIRDVRKHRPELFKGISKNSEEEAKIVNDFVYHSCGETTALGVDTSTLVDFYPTLVINDSKGTKVRFPWGTSYNITNGALLSLYSIADAFNIEMSPEEEAKYKAIASSVLDEIYAHFNGDSTLNVFKSIIDKDVDMFTYDMVRLLSLITDERDLDAMYYVFASLNEDGKYDDKISISSSLIENVSDARDLINNKSVLSNKLYTSSELRDTYFSNTRDVRLDTIAKKVFDTFESVCKHFNCYIRGTSYLTEYVMLKNLFPGRINPPGNVVGLYTSVETILYKVHKPKDYNATYDAETIIHEVLHFISCEILDTDANLKHSFETLFDTVYEYLQSSGDFSTLNVYGFTNVYEFIAEYSNPSFRNILANYGYFDEYENLVNKLLDIDVSSIVLSKTNVKAEGSLDFGQFDIDVLDSLDFVKGDLSKVYNHFVPYKIKTAEVGGEKYDIVYSKTGVPVYLERKMNDLTLSLVRTNDNVFLIDSLGRLVKTLEAPTGAIGSTVGKIDNMSLKVTNEQDKKLVKAINDKIKELRTENSKISNEKLASELLKAFPFLTEEIVNDIIKNNQSLDNIMLKLDSSVDSWEEDAYSELEELNENSKEYKEDLKVKNRQDRNYVEPDEGERIVYNTTGKGEWVQKVARVDENGNFIRNKDGHIIYDYKYNKKRYVSQKKSSGTNLEKYGYTGKYKVTQMSESLEHFIVNATKDIDKELWDKLTSGKLTSQYVMDYFRDSDTIDDKTFKLINESFFHNTKIKTFDELKDYLENKTSKYYAMRALAKSLGFNDIFMANANPNLLERFIEIVNKDSELKQLFDQIESRYYSYKDTSLIISEKNLRRLWMQYFDGSAATAGYLAAVAKYGAVYRWQITGENSNRTRSFGEEVAEDLTLEDTLADEASDVFEQLYNSADKKQKIDDIMKVMAPAYVKKLMSKGANYSQVSNKLSQKRMQLEDMDDKELTKYYAKYVKNMTDEEINSIFAKHLIVESAGIDASKLTTEQLDKVADIASKTIPVATRPARAISNNIKAMVRTIKSNLSNKDANRFYKDNSDIFTTSIDIKPELIGTKNDKGKIEYVETDKLIELENRVRQLSKDVRGLAYKSTRALNLKRKMEKEYKRLENEYAQTVQDLSKGTTDKVVSYNTSSFTYEIPSEEIKIDTTKKIPDALATLLKHEFTKVVKNKTQYLTEGDKYHFKTSIKTFLEDNAQILSTLSQEDINAIADFYSTSEILPSTTHARRYSAIQLAMLTYLIDGNRKGRFVIDGDVISKLEEKAELIVGVSAENVANWKQARKMLKPNEVLLQSLAKICDVEFTEGDIEQLNTAIESGDVSKMQEAKKRMYNKVVTAYNGKKTSVFDKLLRFERMAMLSGPGTMIRNKVSNVMVEKGNITGEYLGDKIFNIFQKMFPKKFKSTTNQYKLVGTKVTSEIKTFIQREIIDSGLLSLVRDGLSKYDVRRQHYDKDMTISGMIIESIKNELFQKNTFESKLINDAQALIMKGLSDTNAIDKAALRYFGKMLVEDNVRLDVGLNNKILKIFAEAYRLAAHDYMHKSNFFNKIELELKRTHGEKAYFMYKQIFPFAAASWNWFMEGLEYTPVGLMKGIFNLSKLESTIEKMESKRQAGENVISGRFAEYLAKRQIGKGVIGSICMGIGLILAGLGFAGIDEEDEKYKLFINIGSDTVYVDISDVFGTQGVMLGIAIGHTISKSHDYKHLLSETFNLMFDDSVFSDVFNTFRYSNNFGEWLTEQPFAMLNMFIPNFLKTISSVANKYDVKFSDGILGKFQRVAVNTVPFLAYAFPKQVDPYTGEYQISYKAWFATKLVNKLLPLKIYPYNVSDAEKIAISLGVNKSTLTGKYEVNGEEVNLNAKHTQEVNEYYGKLNKQSLDELINNRQSYKVWDEKKNEYVTLKYNKMTDKQKKTVIERIMNDNSQTARIYMLTSNYGYKYFANDSEYYKLKKLGIKNIYKKNNVEGLALI